MTGSIAVDIATGLVLVYFLLALLASAVNEFLATLFAQRAATLEAGILQLLDGVTPTTGEPFAAAFYRHGIIQSLQSWRWISMKNPTSPSYIPARLFRAAVEDILVPGSPAAGPRSLQGIRASLGTLPASDMKVALLAFTSEAGGDIDAWRSSVEHWFDDSMERVTGWYKRRVQLFLLGIGVVLAVALNADSFSIANRLTHSPEVRAFVVAAAERLAKETPAPGRDLPCPSATPASPAASPCPAADFAAMRTTLAQLDDLQLPIGWTKDPWTELNDLWRQGGVPAVLERIFGLLVTAIAVSFGAPFWFDLLGKLVSLRSTGRKPPTAQAEAAPKP